VPLLQDHGRRAGGRRLHRAAICRNRMSRRRDLCACWR
jgi:hypothetical protein